MLSINLREKLDCAEVTLAFLTVVAYQKLVEPLVERVKTCESVVCDFVRHPIETSLGLYFARKDQKLARVCDPWEYMDIQHRNKDWDYGLL